MSASQNAQSLWRLTSHKLGRRFLGLDVAGNVVFYPMFNASRIGGWSAATTQMNPQEDAEYHRSNVMISGRPVHWKAVKALDKIVRQQLERQKAASAAAQQQRAVGSDAQNAAKKAEEVDTAESSSAGRTETETLHLNLPTGKELRKLLRLNRLVTYAYKSLYWSIVAFVCYVALCGFARFRNWLNAPARCGLDGILLWLGTYPLAVWAFLQMYSPPWTRERFGEIVDLYYAMEDHGGYAGLLLTSFVKMWPGPPCEVAAASAASVDAPGRTRRVRKIVISAEEQALAVEEQEYRQKFRLRAIMAFLAALVLWLFL